MQIIGYALENLFTHLISTILYHLIYKNNYN